VVWVIWHLTGSIDCWTTPSYAPKLDLVIPFAPRSAKKKPESKKSSGRGDSRETLAHRVKGDAVTFGIEELREKAMVGRDHGFANQDLSTSGFDSVEHNGTVGSGVQINHGPFRRRDMPLAMDNGAAHALSLLVQKEPHGVGAHFHLGHFEIKNGAVKGFGPCEISDGDFKPVKGVGGHFHGAVL
jgi:hypothetical protein